ncbi:hypothetical protein HZB02_07460 [Candidatus Woesearchaeota archaeon]|nr:hypothetical protein [Candidatus Woesearchaeota archaeon]
MVSIDRPGFAKKVEEYLITPERFNQEGVEHTLNLLDLESLWAERKGIRFGYNTELMLRLLSRAYAALEEPVDSHTFAENVAESVEHFAAPFSTQDNLCYPHFLFHGIAQPTLEGITARIEKNSRIIHEMGETNRETMDRYGTAMIQEDLQLTMNTGLTDDYFGIALLLLTKRGESSISSATGYIAKCGFFTDAKEKEMYVMTIQARRFGEIDPHRKENQRDGQREYNRISIALGMGPRTFVLMELMKYAREKGFQRIKVITPEEHPMSIEGHKGFQGSYRPIILKAGITEENGCYLEKNLL